MSINLRIRLIIEQNKMNATEFSVCSGIPYRSLQNYLRGEREPNSEAYLRFAQMGVNINWLLTGQGEMFINEVVDDLTQEEASLIDDFRHMNEQGKAAVTTSARAMAQQELFKKNKVS